MIIGLVGFIGSGKNSAAEYLIAAYNFKQESFASSLKDTLSCIFGWNRNKLEGISELDREWRNQIDPWWAQQLNMPDLTPRKMLQQIGTDLFRDHFHNDIWIASLENKLQKYSENIVVTDCRFPNEIEAIRKLGGIIVRVKRGIEPEWFNDALYLNQNPNTKYQDFLQDRLDRNNIHSSEIAWIGTEFDYILENDKSLVDLYLQVDKLLKIWS